MKTSIVWWLNGFGAAAVHFTGNWWWALTILAALAIDLSIDAFWQSKVGRAIRERRRSQ